MDSISRIDRCLPGRLSGSQSLEQAIRWAADAMRGDGLENVRIDTVMVPHWVRGAESAEIVASPPQHIAISALGGTVGTGPPGIRAQGPCRARLRGP